MSFLKKFLSTKPKCPYCNTSLEELPKRAKNCPSCGNKMYVREGKLYTKEQIDIQSCLSRLSFLEVSEASFQKTRDELSKQFGTQASINDTAWRILNEATKTRDPNTLKLIYSQMVDVAREEGKDPKPYQIKAAKVTDVVKVESKDPKPYQIKAAKAELNAMKDVKDLVVIRISTRNDDFVCPECRKLEKQQFTWDEAYKTLPIPNRCTNPDGCRCSYSAEIKSKK